jgi:hypothetical protein
MSQANGAVDCALVNIAASRLLQSHYVESTTRICFCFLTKAHLLARVTSLPARSLCFVQIRNEPSAERSISWGYKVAYIASCSHRLHSANMSKDILWMQCKARTCSPARCTNVVLPPSHNICRFWFSCHKFNSISRKYV